MGAELLGIDFLEADAEMVALRLFRLSEGSRIK